MEHIEFKTIYVDKDAPEVKSFLRVESIDLLEINTAGDDTENTGVYYVWVTLRSGVVTPIFRGTLEACKQHYEMITRDMKEQ